MGKKWKKKTQECLNNIRIRFPTYENECYAKRTRILRTMIIIQQNSKNIDYDFFEKSIKRHT